MSHRPFRFAVQAANATSGDQWRSLARKVEELGYSTLFLADHYDYHVSAVLAKEAATLDLLSDGRLEFGVGAGWSDGEYRAMGLEFGTAPRRIAKLREVVALFKAQCAGEELNFRGEFVTAAGYAGRPRPVQRPHPPVMIGGARKRMLSFAGREADIVSISNVPFVERNDAGLTPAQEMQARIGYVRSGAGERLNGLDIESSPYFTAVTDDPGAALAAIGCVRHRDVAVPPCGARHQLRDRATKPNRRIRPHRRRPLGHLIERTLK
jgi:alkanesulfonate monooxygenase SsuD/methylene tetrahydromethanopterin reductase-like flavin-dependent oxidoreductase (luciferase family)